MRSTIACYYPAPEAQQLAIYLGWLMHRTLGGIVAGVLFILPGALVVLALSILYAGYQQLIIVAALFYGVKAAILAIVYCGSYTHRAKSTKK